MLRGDAVYLHAVTSHLLTGPSCLIPYFDCLLVKAALRQLESHYGFTLTNQLLLSTNTSTGREAATSLYRQPDPVVLLSTTLYCSLFCCIL